MKSSRLLHRAVMATAALAVATLPIQHAQAEQYESGAIRWNVKVGVLMLASRRAICRDAKLHGRARAVGDGEGAALISVSRAFQHTQIQFQPGDSAPSAARPHTIGTNLGSVCEIPLASRLM
ncbi:hypothetical protein [Burkholderia pseudomultivorans]|uniref:hypothetical protein n=1 Tax=Burkholderia pseudomultivorans TaxID=1207504 RepID=UPI000A84075C|nr:hypothetical protein [Burkholderia pseudomultivorans]